MTKHLEKNRMDYFKPLYSGTLHSKARLLSTGEKYKVTIDDKVYCIVIHESLFLSLCFLIETSGNKATYQDMK